MTRIMHVDEAHVQQLRDLFDEYLKPLRDYAKDKVDLNEIPTFENVDAEIATLPGIFAPPKGRFFVALDDSRVIGCVALKPVSESVCELKRMYVKPGYRGQRVGWRLVETLIAAAREIGYSKIILDSHISMTKAHSIYRGAGFNDVPEPEGFPEFLHGQVVFMEMDLNG
jgi:GNAT superfamily N-acetyltransferase